MWSGWTLKDIYFLGSIFWERMGEDGRGWERRKEDGRGLERIGEEERGGERNWRFVNACL